MRLTFRVETDYNGCRLAAYLRHMGMSTSRIRSVKYTEAGLAVNGARARTNQVLHTGDVVVVSLAPEAAARVDPEAVPLDILYEDAHAMVVNKPAGMVVHPTRSHKTGTLAAAFAGLMQQRGTPRAFRPVGRLDGGTSGLLLLAMNAYAAPLLAKSFEKEYLALVEGRVEGPGTVNAPLGPAPDSVVRQCVRPDGRMAVTRYTPLAAGQNATLLAFSLKTGRTHQIRAHMAHLGHPLLGDGLYGGPPLLARQALHCHCLRFTPPAGAPVGLYSPLPPDMAKLLESCEIDPAVLAKAGV